MDVNQITLLLNQLVRLIRSRNNLKPLIPANRHSIERSVNMTKNFSITTNMKNMTGITLIELMVTLAVIAILVAVGVPRLSGIATGNRMSSTINALAADIALARSEAINRNRDITINQAPGGWSNGWTLDAIATVGLAAEELKRVDPVPTGMTLVESNGIGDLPYGSDGMNSSGVARVFTLCEPGKQARIINVNVAGRYTVKTDGGPACP